jgi:hypothetical protein
MHANAICLLQKHDGASVCTPIVGKRINLFKKQGWLEDDQHLEFFFENFTEEEEMKIEEY